MFLSVGTDFIYPEFFVNIKNTGGAKPVGGIWATKQTEIMQYNPWIDFVLSRPNLLFYKSNGNPFKQPAVLIKLKDAANICTVDSEEKMDLILKSFPDGNGWIDFEKLAECYDGLFISYNKLLASENPKVSINIRPFSVDTLIIFNPNCIEYFQKASVEIEPFNFDMPSFDTRYQIIVEEEKNYLCNPNAEVQLAIGMIAEYIRTNNVPMDDEHYAVIRETFASLLEKAKSAVNDEEHQTHYDFETLLIRKAFSQS